MEGGGGVDPKETIFSPLILYLGEYEVLSRLALIPGELRKFTIFIFYHAWLNILEYSPLRLCTHSIHILYRYTLSWLYLRPRRRGGGGCRSERNHILSMKF